MASMKLQPRACPICHSLDDSQSFAEANVDLEELDGFAFASRSSGDTISNHGEIGIVSPELVPLTADESDRLSNACETTTERLVVWTLLDKGSASAS